MDSKNKEYALLEQYNRKLEDENSAKTEQIKILRNQLQAQSTTTTRVISSSFSATPPICSNCKNKELQISNLKKSLKELQDSSDATIKKFSSQKQRIVYKEVESTATRDELDKLRKAYDDLKTKYDESQKVDWSRLKVDGNESSKPDNQSLRQLNNVLSAKVQFLQKRLVAVQDANRILNEEVLMLRNCSSLKQKTRVQLGTISECSKPATNGLAAINIMQPNIPTFRYLPSPERVVSFNLPQAPESYLHGVTQKQQLYQSHLSPLAVLERGCGGSFGYSMERGYHKDIVEERWRSLQHKIKVLEQENNKLRTEFAQPLLYY